MAIFTFMVQRKYKFNAHRSTNNNIWCSNENYIHYCILKNIYNICTSRFEDQKNP